MTVEELERAVAELALECMSLRADICALEGDEAIVSPNCSDEVLALAGPALDRLEAKAA